MKYHPIIDLRVRHAYYADGRCADFAVEPSAETQRVLAGCRCLVQAFPDGVQISAAVTADGRVFAVLPAGETLVFRLRLKNADFALFTDLTDFQALPAARFTNAGANPTPVLRLDAITTSQTEFLVFPIGAMQADFLLGGSPLGDATAAQFELDGLDAGAAVTRGAKSREITVTAARSVAARAFTVIYPVIPQLPPGVFARVEIVPPPAAGGVAALSAYEVRFRPLAARWRYYLVSPPAGTCAYSLDYGQTASFALTAPEAADPVGQGLQTQYGAAARVDCFTSKTPLLSGDATPAGLRLMHGSDGEPLPAPRELCSLGDTTPALFRIVRKT